MREEGLFDACGALAARPLFTPEEVSSGFFSSSEILSNSI
jgi:hypothetical protein